MNIYDVLSIFDSIYLCGIPHVITSERSESSMYIVTDEIQVQVALIGRHE
jgi:hypothetical protein